MLFAQEFAALIVFFELLGNDAYHVRHQAYCALNSQLDYRIMLFQPNPNNLEQKIRLRQLQNDYVRIKAERWYEKFKDADLPWIYGSDKDKYLYHKINDLKDNPDLKDWPRWRRATAIYIRDRILQDDLTPREISDIMYSFAEEERKWWSNNGTNVDNP